MCPSDFFIDVDAPGAAALDRAEAALQRWMRALGSALIALSGGVDSSLMLSAAAEALGDRALAVTLDAGTLPAFEIARAAAIARAIGARHRMVAIDLEGERCFRENPLDRCYHCKRALFSRLLDIARTEGFAAVLEGSNRDDLGDHRPGLAAVRELGARSPFLELGFDKALIRALAERRKIASWNAPARACLATRIPHGTPITREALRRVEALECALLARGFSDARVREAEAGALARIELPAAEIGRALDPVLREEIAAAGEAAGYRFVAIDLRGYRRGSMSGAAQAGRARPELGRGRRP